MNVTLHVISGPATGRRIRLQTGQVGRFGRTEWSDFSFPDDKSLAEVHFLLQCDPAGPRLRDLQTPTGTQLNGQNVAEAELHAGDEIIAGATRFLVEVDGQGATPADIGRHAAAGKNANGPIITAAMICQTVELEDKGRSLLTDIQTPQKFASLLAEHGQLRDAVRFTAAWLPKRDAVLWGSQCVRNFMGENILAEDAAAVQIVDRWSVTPTEDLRRDAEQIAEQIDGRTPAGWLAMAVFWSGGSLAPPECDPVPPPEHLTATGVAAALLLAAAQAPPLEIDAVLQGFLSKVHEGSIS